MAIFNQIPIDQAISETWRDTGNISKNILIQESIEDIVKTQHIAF